MPITHAAGWWMMLVCNDIAMNSSFIPSFNEVTFLYFEGTCLEYFEGLENHPL